MNTIPKLPADKAAAPKAPVKSAAAATLKIKAKAPTTVASKPTAKVAIPAATKAKPAVKVAVKAPARAISNPAAAVAIVAATQAPAKRKAKPASPAKAPATKASAPVKDGKHAGKKPKLVRDSFTFPAVDYALFASLKQRALKAGHEVKKSELLRAGLAALAGLSDTALLKAVQNIDRLKPGRPTK